MKCYHPEGIYVWDTWYYEYEGEVHCTFLQQARPGYPEKAGESGALGHAVTRDLLHWEYRPSVLYPGEKGTYDDGQLWTGNTFVEGNRRYLFYTANHFVDGVNDESIGLAVSEDGEHYTRHPESPVIRCDPSIYVAYSNPSIMAVHGGHNLIDCRDLCVVKDPDGNGYWGYFAARIHENISSRTSVIALAHSEDLVHWKQYPPCFTPNRYACVEVPEVFYLDGKWWMLCLTGNGYGQRFKSGQPEWSSCTIQAVADHPWGPFTELHGHEVLGAPFQEGFSSKTVAVDGRRYMFYTQGERIAGSSFGSISLPAELQVRGDHLVPLWCKPLENVKREILLESDQNELLENDGRWSSPGIWKQEEGFISGECDGDWSVRLWDGAEADMVMEGYVNLHTAEAAGFTFRASEEGICNAYQVILDAERGEIFFTKTRDFPILSRKKIPVNRNQEYHLRVVACGSIFTVYVNDELTLQLFNNWLPDGYVGLYTENGKASFRDVKVWGVVD